MNIKTILLYIILLLYIVYGNTNYNMNILRNRYLRFYLIHYKKEKINKFIDNIKYSMYYKVNNMYNSILSRYYDLNSFYYNLSDEEKILIDNIIALMY